MLFFASFLYLAGFINSAPIEMITVDMTHVYDENSDMPRWPGVKKFEMTVVANGSFEGIEWLQSEEFVTSTHMGTHMDAPAHFTLGGLTIDQIPASRLIAPAAVINIKHKAAADSDAEVTIQDLEHWERATGRSLDGTIVLINSGWDKKWRNRTEFLGTDDDDHEKLSFPGISPEAAQWLVDNRDVNGVGVDTVSLDRGNSKGARTHVIVLGRGIFGLENVANLDHIPISGATLYVAPMKIGRASGAPTRIIATFPKVIFDQSEEFCRE